MYASLNLSELTFCLLNYFMESKITVLVVDYGISNTDELEIP